MIGGVFLVIVLFSPDGLLGWWGRSAICAQEALRSAPDGPSV